MTSTPENRNRKSGMLVVLLSLFTAIAALLGWHLHLNSAQDKKLKTDYFTVNQIKYGLLSGNNWTYQVNRILIASIDSFNIDEKNRRLLEAQMTSLLERLFDEADRVLHKERDNWKDRIKFGLLNSMVDLNDFKPDIPKFSRAIVDELNKSRYKKDLKTMIKKKVSSFLNAVNQDTIGERSDILKKYDRGYIADFNYYVGRQTEFTKRKQRELGLSMLAVLACMLLVWIYILRIRRHYAITFLFSVLISFIALFTGISLPMIEIDARISELNLNLLSGHIVFKDQIIFYQAKSILDVVRILITDGTSDTVFVGFLILLFSVLFPVTKLICTTIYLYVRERGGKFVHFMAFNSGKWSMADVMVVAIFMSYVGFRSILDNQLDDIAVKNDTVNVLTTNKTNLQTGFMVFVGFCLFALILAEILKKISRQQKVINPAVDEQQD